MREQSDFVVTSSRRPHVTPNLYRKFMTGVTLFPTLAEEALSFPHKLEVNPLKSDTTKISIVSDGRTHLTKFELSSSKVANDDEEATECLRCLWPFFRLSRLIGMCPILRHGNHLVIPRLLSPAWLLTLIALGVQIVMLGNAVKIMIESVQDNNTDSTVDAGNNVIYYMHTFGNSLFMIWKIRKLPKFLVACKRIETLCKKYTMKNDGLVRDCLLLFYFFASTQALGNVLYYYSVAMHNKVTSVGKFFHAFNSEFIGEWGSFYTGIFFGLGELYCDMGWTFADMLLGLISLILSRYFVRINRVLGERGAIFNLATIEELRRDHRDVCHLVKHCNDVFAPLFLLTYVANVGYLFTRLYTGLQEDLSSPTYSIRVESFYAFTYQIFIKIMLPSYLAARLNEKAHEGLDLIHSWPSALDDPESKYRLLVIGRFISQFVSTQVGISGCNFFIITKSFVVTLISALITYEVIILQFQAAAASKPLG